MLSRFGRCFWAGMACWLGSLNAPGAVWHWSNPMPHGNNIVGLGFYNGLTIEACDAGQIYTSDDLNLWLPRNTNTTYALQAIAVLGNRVIVTGESGSVFYSDDGVDYTYTNLLTSDWLVAVTASSNLAVAVGDNAAIYTSTDGAWWKRQAVPPGVGGNWLRGVTYGAGTFVMVGEGGYIATSTNGTNWTYHPLPIAPNLNAVAWVSTPGNTNGLGAPLFRAVSDGGESIISTNSGITWSLEKNFATTNSLYATTGDNGSRLIAGDNELYLGTVTTNRLLWQTQIGTFPGSAPAWTYYAALWETNPSSMYIVGGDSGMVITNSVQGANYNWYPVDNSSRSWLWQATVISNLYVAVGDQARIMTSDNGADWAIEAIPYTNGVSATNTVFFGVGGSSNLLIAVGSGGTTVLSTNSFTTVVTTNSDGSFSTNQISTIGIIWNPMPPPTTNDLHGVGFMGNQYYISGGNGTILSSPDGSNWTKQSTPTTAYLSGLETFPGGMVAVGDTGVILTSPDGVAWTQRASGTTNWIYRVRYLGGTLIAVGENGTILTSADGIGWSPQASGTTEWLNDVQMVTNTFFIVGTTGTILSSTDTTSWTPVQTITGKSLYGAATQNGQLVIVGIQGVILRKQIVPVLTPVNFLSFARTAAQDVFLMAGYVDQQFTLDSSPDLANWTTGPLLDMSGNSALLFYLNTGTNGASPQYFRTTLVP